MRQTNGRRAPASASRPSVARPTTNRSGVLPSAKPNATSRAWRWGAGRASMSESSGRHSWWSPANGISNSDSTPAICASRQPDARPAQYPSNAVLPIPASPRSTSTPLLPPRTCSSRPSSAAHSCARPRNDGALPAFTHERYAQSDGFRKRPRTRRQGVLELLARRHPQLHEHLAQMPLDRARAEKQLGADLRVRAPVSRQPDDVRLLRRELVSRRRIAAQPAHGLARRGQLLARPLRERLGAYPGEYLVRGGELLARVVPPPRRVQPLAV